MTCYCFYLWDVLQGVASSVIFNNSQVSQAVESCETGAKERVDRSQLGAFILSGDYSETSNGLWVRHKHFLGSFHFVLARQRWIPFLKPSPLHLAQELKTFHCGVVIVSLATLCSSRHVPCCSPRAIAPLGAVICTDLLKKKVCSDGKFLSDLSVIRFWWLEISALLSPPPYRPAVACTNVVSWPGGGGMSLIMIFNISGFILVKILWGKKSENKTFFFY